MQTENDKYKEALDLLRDARDILNYLPCRKLYTFKYNDSYEFLSVVDKFFRDNKL